jgi:hypothetical protein
VENTSQQHMSSCKLHPEREGLMYNPIMYDIPWNCCLFCRQSNFWLKSNLRILSEQSLG